MYLTTAMEINIRSFKSHNHARLLDTLPSYQTHPAQLPDACVQTEWLSMPTKNFITE